MDYFYYVVALLSAGYVIFDVWTNQPTMALGMKIVWTVIVLPLSALGAVIYYFMFKRL